MGTILDSPEDLRQRKKGASRKAHNCQKKLEKNKDKSVKMAKEKKTKAKKEKKKTTEERTYNIPLRREFLKVPRYKRSKKAVSAVRKFLSKHMKSDNVKVGKYLNLKIWERGIKNPPHHVKVTAKKDEDGTVFAELAGAPAEKKETKKEEAKEKKEKAEKKTEQGKEQFEAAQKGISEGEKAEELEREIEKEATMNPEKKQSEEEIKETIKALKGK